MNTSNSLNTQAKLPEDMTAEERAAEIKALERRRRTLTMTLNDAVAEYEKASGRCYPTRRPKR